MAPFDVSSCLRAASHHLGPDLSGALHDLTFCVFIEAWSIALPGGIVPLPAARVQCLTKALGPRANLGSLLVARVVRRRTAPGDVVSQLDHIMPCSTGYRASAFREAAGVPQY